MRFRLRTLGILTAIVPPALAVIWFADGILKALILWAVAIGTYAAWAEIMEQFWDKPGAAD